MRRNLRKTGAATAGSKPLDLTVEFTAAAATTTDVAVSQHRVSQHRVRSLAMWHLVRVFVSTAGAGAW